MCSVVVGGFKCKQSRLNGFTFCFSSRFANITPNMQMPGGGGKWCVCVCVCVCFFQAIFLASGTSFVAGVYVDREMANGARVGH